MLVKCCEVSSNMCFNVKTKGKIRMDSGKIRKIHKCLPIPLKAYLEKMQKLQLDTEIQ